MHVEVRASHEPKFLTNERAMTDVGAGRSQSDQLLEDQRFSAVATEHGMTIEYTWDYDNGRIKLASITPDRSVIWEPNKEPQT